MEANNKYSSVLKLVNIPPEQPIAVGDKHQFEKNQPGQADAGFIDSQIINTRDQLIDKMEKKISLFDLTNFEFKLPPSKFPDVAPGTTNSISYQQKMYNEYEDTFANRLTSEQVDQIRKKGEFNVYSKSQGSQIPYVWRINQCLLKGRVNRVNIWQDGLAWCYQFMNVAKDFFVQTIPDSCLNLAKMPLKFFDLIFGRKRLKSVYSPNYERQAYKDFWSDIMNNELSDLKFQIGHELLENMYVYYDPAIFLDIQKSIEKEERQKLKKIKDEKTASYNKQIESVNNFKQALRSVESNFEQNWKKIRKNVLNKVSGEVEQYNQKSFMVQGDQQPLSTQIILKKDQTVVEKFLEQKYSLYLAHLKQHLPKTNVASQAVISSLLTLITIFNIIDTKRYAKQAKLSELAQKTRSQIRKNNSIRARSYRFVEKMFEEIYKPLKEQIDLETYDQIAVQLEKLPEFNEKYKSIIKKYWRFKKQFENIVAEKKKVLKNLYVADRVFDSYYILFPPYQVIKQGSYYSLKKTQTCQIDTSHHFWKCSLYAMRLKCWSLNCLKTFLGLSWAGPLGLRCLFGIDDFAYDQGISSSTGDKYDIKRTTFLGVFCTVLDGIKQSRNQFEGKPDLGILGKNCSRICNIIQCYVFRFIFVGVIGVLMCYPVAIILFSTICFLGVLTFWIWTPLVLILVYLFNILVFQFQISMYNAQCIIRAVPLISLVIRILFNVLKIVAAFLFLLIIAPLICLLYIIFLIIQRALRTFTDAVMACLLGCCGRTPSVDTCIATKISGPGMSRQHFYSIAEQDVYVLIQAALQKILMRKLNQLTREKLEVNKKKYEKICSFVFKPFGYTRADIRNQKDLVQKNTSSVLNKFSKKFSNYMNRYPKNPNNIRFTQEEIETYFENSRKIVKNYVQKNQIQGWVFQEHQILNQDYEELTRKLWVQIFNCGESIFEPLQKIDERFKIQASGNHNAGIMKQNVAAITKAIKGQVDLSVQKIGFTPAKRSLLDKDYPLEYISKIFEHHSNNNSHYIFLNLSDPTCLFVPHRNLKELKQYDAYHLKIARQDRGAIIE